MKYDDYATCSRTWVTLCITGKNLVPTDVTARFDIEPSKSHAKGEPVGRFSKGKHKLGGWFLSTVDQVPSADIRIHLASLLARLADKRDALDWVRAQGWKAVVSCFWGSAHGHGGPELTPTLMRQLVELDLTIWFDVYFEADEPRSDTSDDG